MANKDLLVSHYQHLLEVCLKAGAADMSNYCPVNSNSQVAGQFPCLFKQAANLQSLGQVSKSLKTSYSSQRSYLASRLKADFHWPPEFYLSHLSL